MKIVFAAVFIMQVLRSEIPDRDYQNQLKSTLRETISTLGTCSIDSAHPAFRYSILLRCLMSDIEKKAPQVASFPYSWTIGPRNTQQQARNGVDNGLNELGSRPSQVDMTGEEGPPKAGAAGVVSTEAWGRQSSSPFVNEGGSPAPDCFPWHEGDHFNMSWENSLELFDGDMFLQSLMGW
uniref:Uncharacterized protein n=1 Tax=Bionectria ochroleuca TaxID=29856 RepID=A0A8H7TN44_BIOOC